MTVAIRNPIIQQRGRSRGAKVRSARSVMPWNAVITLRRTRPVEVSYRYSLTPIDVMFEATAPEVERAEARSDRRLGLVVIGISAVVLIIVCVAIALGVLQLVHLADSLLV
jgi:hypothetical protein